MSGPVVPYGTPGSVLLSGSVVRIADLIVVELGHGRSKRTHLAMLLPWGRAVCRPNIDLGNLRPGVGAVDCPTCLRRLEGVRRRAEASVGLVHIAASELFTHCGARIVANGATLTGGRVGVDHVSTVDGHRPCSVCAVRADVAKRRAERWSRRR